MFYFRYPDEQKVTIYLNKCYFYKFSSDMYEIGGGDHLSVGLKLPNGKFDRPIRKGSLYWLLPGNNYCF